MKANNLGLPLGTGRRLTEQRPLDELAPPEQHVPPEALVDVGPTAQRLLGHVLLQDTVGQRQRSREEHVVDGQEEAVVQALEGKDVTR